MKRIGILTSGGDCQGLNASIRGVAKSLYEEFGDNVEIYGIKDGYKGLIFGEYKLMKPEDFSGILTLGGTILGTSRQPFKLMRVIDENSVDKVKNMKDNYRKMNLDCLVILGGNGTQKTANLLREEGLNVVSLPKTIDNDVWGTDMTFGFHSSVEIATNVIDCIHTTATSHGRIFCVEIMGHKVGWLPLYAGIAGGADVILLPEIPFSIDKVCEAVSRGYAAGKRCCIIAVGEGAVLDSEAPFKRRERVFVRADRGETTVTRHLAEVIGERTGAETRATVLGYIQRGGEPSAYDRVLCTRLGSFAAQLCRRGRFGVTVAVSGNRITFNALTDIAGKYKFVDPNGEIVRAAEETGVSFGR